MGQGVGRAWPWPLEPQTLSLLLGSVQKGLRERGSSSAFPLPAHLPRQGARTPLQPVMVDNSQQSLSLVSSGPCL